MDQLPLRAQCIAVRVDDLQIADVAVRITAQRQSGRGLGGARRAVVARDPLLLRGDVVERVLNLAQRAERGRAIAGVGELRAGRRGGHRGVALAAVEQRFGDARAEPPQ
ncbi:hypothetical protein WT83_19020 [Burkholderia territorii]|uniref:Uncharacterized protein n=1 Tax=Burkholderia territorii TaxID=1503055 RepID=A0A108ELC9_9BURK|nr:hypothetical protein WT83_19020 [Burkholderia territorii]